MEPFKRLHPGYFIKQALYVTNVSIEEFSKKTTIDKDRLTKLLNSEIDIEEIDAEKLSKYFSCTKEYWLNLQKDYDEYVKDFNIKKH